MEAFDSIFVGSELPTLVKAPDRQQLVKYAAGSGDFNPLHYDPEYPQAEQIGDNIVHGRMKYAALGELVSNWLRHQGRVVSISCQYRGMDMRGAEFTCRGVIIEKDDETRLVELELWVENEQGERTTPGRAIVEFDK